MMGKQRTPLVDSVLGQHVALSVAAHLARSLYSTETYTTTRSTSSKCWMCLREHW